MKPTARRLRLPNVTICSADCAYPDLTCDALIRSIGLCEFGDAVFFSDKPRDGPYRFVQIPRLNSIQDYSDFCLAGLSAHIKTDFVLVIQWDGFVVDSGLWRGPFEKFDYIGAAWHGRFSENRRVGNGGFSLRSRRLLDALRSFPIVPNLTEDLAISQIHRPQLEDRFAIRFASEKIADQFSYEMEYRKPTFGFHGFFNMWRYLDDDEMFRTATSVWDRRFKDQWKFTRLIVECQENGRGALADRLYRALRVKMSHLDMLAAPTGLAAAGKTLAQLEARISAGAAATPDVAGP